MKIKLLKKEEKLLDDYWNFVSIFIPPYKTAKVYGLYGPSDYRKDIIAKISKIYTVEQFYFYENMLNKMLWILIHHIDFDITKINKSEKCHYPLLFKTYNDNNYLENSFSHKEFIKDEINNLCYEYTNYPELSDIKIIHQIAMIISNRKLYDTIIKTTKDKIKNKLRNKLIGFIGCFFESYLLKFCTIWHNN